MNTLVRRKAILATKAFFAGFAIALFTIIGLVLIAFLWDIHPLLGAIAVSVVIGFYTALLIAIV